ncbi:hypothetical protein CTI14_65470, partial [Methylobacterium radiotolerans]
RYRARIAAGLVAPHLRVASTLVVPIAHAPRIDHGFTARRLERDRRLLSSPLLGVVATARGSPRDSSPLICASPRRSSSRSPMRRASTT